MLSNTELAEAFQMIALILDLKEDDNPFRKRAYERAVETIEGSRYDIRDIYADGGIKGLLELPGIGKEIALKIEELLKTGDLTYLKKLKKEIPQGLFDILAIEGMGPKKTKFVWKEFGVKDIGGLVVLAKSGDLEGLKGWGEKSVHNILKNIELKKKSKGRMPMKDAKKIADKIVAALKKSKLCDQIEVAGSLRRKKETVGDIDILVTSKKPEEVMDFFCSLPDIESVHSKGSTKSSVFLKTGIDADIRVVEEKVFGAALQYFTGSKAHNVKLRKLALKKGVTISEYGVYEGTAAHKGNLVASRTEEDVYKAVGLRWIPPEKRLDRGEIEEAMEIRT